MNKTKAILLAAAGGLGAMLLMSPKAKASTPVSDSGPMSEKHAPTRALITSVAEKYGVPPKVALRFAWIESKFNSKAEGDFDWSKKPIFQTTVVKSKKFAQNPYRTDPSVWHSYGLFQLLAPYFVSGKESPKVLLDAQVNTERAMKKIAASLKAAKGDDRQARILYAGASKSPQTVKDKILKNYDATKGLFP